MSTHDEPKAQAPETERPRCDHICLLDDGHVDRGEPHFYGYELPSPRAAEARVVAAETALAATRNGAHKALLVMNAVVSSPVCHPHNVVMLRDGIADLRALLDVPDQPTTDEPTP